MQEPGGLARNGFVMRNRTLHAALEAFGLEVSGALQAELAAGAEMPFEVVEEPAGATPLYCYRALTSDFIDARLGLLTALPTFGSAARALEGLEDLAAYLRQRGVRRAPANPRDRAGLALELFLQRMFYERTHFEFDRGRFEAAFAELERSVYEDRCVITVIAPLAGVALDQQCSRMVLGEGLELVEGELVADAPPEAVWGEGGSRVLALFSVVQERRQPAPVALARSHLRRLVSALRLFEPGEYALGPTAWLRVDSGAWRPLALPFSGRPGASLAITAAHEDELRGFFNLILSRAPVDGRLAWALERFEMGAERLSACEALTDYLLAGRALLEPEESPPGTLADRLAAICATPEERPRVRERIAQAVALEQALVSGAVPSERDSGALVTELSDNLRALLRDIICGHLEGDLCALADELLEEPVLALSPGT